MTAVPRSPSRSLTPSPSPSLFGTSLPDTSFAAAAAAFYEGVLVAVTVRQPPIPTPTPARAACGAPVADAGAGAGAVVGPTAAEGGPTVDGLQTLDHQGGGHHEDDRGRHGHEVMVAPDELQVLRPRHEEEGDLGHLHAPSRESNKIQCDWRLCANTSWPSAYFQEAADMATPVLKPIRGLSPSHKLYFRKENKHMNRTAPT